MLSNIQNFLKLESASGIILVIAAVLAMIFANTPLAPFYDQLTSIPVEVRIGDFAIDKPLLLWINDGLMAVFFFLVGLELKRELIEGELSTWKKISLPLLGAIGGMAAPAAVYSLLNWGDPVAMEGWAIPAATDIAFALGVLTLLGKRVPSSLKVFLVSLAIFDDVGAIIIIALFYTTKLSLLSLAVASVCLIVAFILNRRGVTELTPYLLVGLIMWTAVLKSGVHATLAGVALALFIPLRDAKNPKNSPLRQLEHDLHTVVAFGILPIFAFANAGVTLTGVGIDAFLHGVPLGIALGLFLGKQIGIVGLCWLGVKMGIASLPERVTWSQLYGVAILCGVGFTMSLFIGSLAFEESSGLSIFDERIGILAGSLLSGVVGYLILRRFLPREAANPAFDG